MFEEVLRQKKHFILIGGNDANIIIGTDAIDEIASQDWFIGLMAKEMDIDISEGVTEEELAKAAAEEARRFKEQEDEMRRQERFNRMREMQKAAQTQQQPPMQREQQRAPIPVPTPPRSLEFPFLDIGPDEMNSNVWVKMTPEQQNQWRQKYLSN